MNNYCQKTIDVAVKLLKHWFYEQANRIWIYFQILICYSWFYLIDIELALPSGQFSVAGGELSNKIMTARKIDLDKKNKKTVIRYHNSKNTKLRVFIWLSFM